MEFTTALINQKILRAVVLLGFDDDLPQVNIDKQNNNKFVQNVNPTKICESEFEHVDVKKYNEDSAKNIITNKTDENNIETNTNTYKTDENDLNNNENDMHYLPNTLAVGQAIADGSCFFDSFRQGLQRLGTNVTVKELRQNCKQFAEVNPPEWFVTAIGNSHQHDAVRRETVAEYIENIEKNERWGDSNVEGRILCTRYNVTLYVIEKQRAADKHIYTYQIVNSNGCKCVANVDFTKANALYIVNRGLGHFEPIVEKSYRNNDMDLNSQAVQNTDKLDNNSTSYRKPIYKKLIQKPTQTVVPHINDVEKRLIINAFNKFKDAIRCGDIERLSKLIKFLYQTVDKAYLVNIYEDESNTIRNTHLITLACKYNKPKVLDFLLHKSNILCYLPSDGHVVSRAYFDAICETMRAADIRMLETLYDYWSGDVHWLGHVARSDANAVLDNLKRLNVLFVRARDKCRNILEVYQQMLVDVQCLICFNSFQIRTYTELSKLKTKSNSIDVRRNEVEDTIDVLQTAFRVYEEYTEKNIRLTKSHRLDKFKLQPLLNQDSIYMKYLTYYMYELYYRKLDHNMALLIVNNLHLLKSRVAMQHDAYQEIECSLYYFLFRVNEDWKLYLPENRPQSREPALGIDDEGILKLVKVLHDPHRLYNGPVIYLEWLRYKKSLRKFKDALQNIDIDNSLRAKVPKDEVNNLLLLPYMRDDYSLKKILHYMEQISCVDFRRDKEISLLIIQRVVQVTGEFLKSTKDSYHLSPTTLALLHAEIPRKTYQQILDLRDDLSHAREGKLIRRIDLEQNESRLLEDLFADLEQIKKAIREVIKIYKPVLEKSLLRQGWGLICDRYAELPEETSTYIRAIEAIFESFKISHEVYLNLENNFMNEHWKPLGLTRQLFREIGGLGINMDDLRQQWYQRKHDSRVLVTKKLCKYMKPLLQVVAEIERDIVNWALIKHDLESIKADDLASKVEILDYPNTACIKNIKKYLKTINQNARKDEILQKLDMVKDWNTEWDQIKQLLSFIVEEVDYFEEHHWEIKKSMFTRTCKQIGESSPNQEKIDDVRWLINNMNEYSKGYIDDDTSSNTQPDEQTYEYVGVQTLTTAMSKKFFITNNEMVYLKRETNGICECKNGKCNHCKVFQKLYANQIINEKEHKNLESLKINDKCRKIIENLVNGKTRNSKMLECLVMRTRLLSELLKGDAEAEKLALRYRHDQRFRIALEMIVSDILNVYQEGWLTELANKSSSKLLAEYPLRNILEHGNPLIDVSSIAFDENYFPNEIVTFALEVVDDGSYLETLWKLYEDDVDRVDVIADSSDKLSEEHRGLVDKFKECAKWRIYVKLLPDKSQIWVKKKENKQFRKPK